MAQRRSTRRPRDGIRPRAPAPTSAVVTTSTACPRSARKSASAGAWLAGPPGSGGQIPETTTTLTTGAPSRRPPACDLGAETRDHDEPGAGEDERRRKDGDRSSRRAPLGAEHGHERDRHERLEPVGHDPQSRPPDRDGEGLRPAQREVDRGCDQDRPARPWTAPSYSEPKTTRMSHGIATKNTGTATTMIAPAHFE